LFSYFWRSRHPAPLLAPKQLPGRTRGCNLSERNRESQLEHTERGGVLTAWCTNAARLQNAKVTSTDVRFPVLNFSTRSVAADRVISTSFGVSRSEEAISSTAEVFDAGLWTSHSLGIEAWMRARFSAARSCQFDAMFGE
jgi:hypothetical protein